jgi:hypothetical protein
MPPAAMLSRRQGPELERPGVVTLETTGAVGGSRMGRRETMGAAAGSRWAGPMAAEGRRGCLTGGGRSGEGRRGA